MSRTSPTPAASLSDRLQRVLDCVKCGPELTLTDADLDDYYEACTKQIQRFTETLDGVLAQFRENVNIYSAEEIYNIDYQLWVDNIEAVRAGVLNDVSGSASARLRSAMKDMQNKLKTLVKQDTNPAKDKKDRIFTNIHQHYVSDYWDTDRANFESSVMEVLQTKPKSYGKGLLKAQGKLLEKIKSCPFMAPCMESSDGNFEEALQGLQTDKTGELNVRAMGTYIYANRKRLGSYKPINEFLKNWMCLKIVRDALDEQSRKDADSQNQKFVAKMMAIIEPLREYRDISREQYDELWKGILGNSTYLELLKKSTLDETYNAKLLLGTIGLLRYNNVLKGSISGLRNLISDKRRDDYMKPMSYTAYGTNSTELTAELVTYILSLTGKSSDGALTKN